MKNRWLVFIGAVILAFLAIAFLFRRGHAISVMEEGSAGHSAIRPNAAPSIGTSPSAAAVDFDKALRDALDQSDPRQRSLEFGELLTRWFENNPDAAIAFVRILPHGQDLAEALLIVIPRLAGKDPDRAVKLANELAATREEMAVFSPLFDQIARGKGDSAEKLLQNVPPGEGRTNALRAIAVARADANILQALDWAKQIADPADRSSAIEATLITRAKRDPRRTIDLAREQLAGPALERTLTEAMRRLSAQDARSAAEVVPTLPDGELKTGATLDVVRALSMEQPQIALNWVKTLPAGHVRDLAVNNVLDFWSAKDPAAAADYVTQLSTDAGRDAAASHLAGGWAARDPTTALQWVAQLSGSTRVAAEVSGVSGWARVDPEAAAQWAAKLPDSDSARDSAVKAALSYWKLRDPDAAARFADAFAEKKSGGSAAR